MSNNAPLDKTLAKYRADLVTAGVSGPDLWFAIFKASRSKTDPEKTLLPTVILINANHESFGDLRRRGFVLAFGWWDFSVKFGLIK